MTGPELRPPRVAAVLARLLLPGDGGGFVRGDLVEEFAVRIREGGGRWATAAWYWKHLALSALAWWRWSAIRERQRSGRGRPTQWQGVTNGPENGGWGMHGLAQDLRFSIRALLRRPGYLLAASLTMALGVGAVTTIFSVVDGVLLRPLPYGDAGRVVAVGTIPTGMPDAADTPPDRRQRLMGSATGNYLDWKERSRSFDAMGAAEWITLTLLEGAGPELVQAARVDEDFLRVLAAEPVLGRSFSGDELAEGGTDALLLSWDAWMRRFGGDPDVVGRTLRSTEGSHPVVGVLPRGFAGPEALGLRQVDFWLPLRTEAARDANRGARSLAVVGRLAPGTGLATARRELWDLHAAVAREHPEGNVFPDGTRFGAGANDLRAETVGDVGRTLLMLLGAVGLLLLVSCVNVASLALARSMNRSREMGVRAALGGSRGRLTRQVLVESLLLGLVGGAAGLMVSYGGVAAFRTLSPGGIPRLDQVAVDGRILVFAMVLSGACGVLFGMVPALHGTGHRLGTALRDTATDSRRTLRLQGGLVAVEVSLALVLVVGAGLLFRSFLHLRAEDLGFRTEGITTFQLRVPTGFTPETTVFWSDLLREVAAVPGVRSAAAASNFPTQETNWRPAVTLPGEDPDRDARGVDAFVASAGFFELLGVRLLRGRDVNPADADVGSVPAVVNQAFRRLVRCRSASRATGHRQPTGPRRSIRPGARSGRFLLQGPGDLSLMLTCGFFLNQPTISPEIRNTSVFPWRPTPILNHRLLFHRPPVRKSDDVRSHPATRPA